LRLRCKYIEPAFYPFLEAHGWLSVERWFSTRQYKTSQPNLSRDDILVPIHVYNNHWIALVRKIKSGIVHFYYSDDLNNSRTESTICETVLIELAPTSARAMLNGSPCVTPNYTPHSNECGPRTVMALAIIGLHPNPHSHCLMDYTHPNLAQIGRYWLGSLLLSADLRLLPPTPQITTPKLPRHIRSLPKELVRWSSTPTDGANEDAKTVAIYSPLHTLLRRAESQQISNSTPLSVQLSQPIVTRQREAAQRLPWIDSEPAIPAKQILTPKAKQPRSNKAIRKIQLTINNSTPPDHSLDDTWGHQLTPIDHISTLRLIFNNVQGLHLRSDIMNTQYSLSTAFSLSASVLCLAETNVNWRHKQANPCLRDILQKTWRNYMHASSHTNKQLKDLKQPGRTITIIANN